MVDEAKTATGPDDRARDRSPPFPFISLEKAIERAREFEAEYKKSAGRLINVFNVWGYTPKSSGGSQTIGALKSFGLIEDEGSGADRKVKLTELGLRILKDERPGKREEGIKEAALKPKALAEQWTRWRSGRPPDRECQSELTLERGFTEDAAKRFIQVYDDTMRFAGVQTSDKPTDKLLNELEALGPKIKTGDLVQWEPGGILQFPEPKRVKTISDKGDFVFVEGSMTGLPISEVKIMTGEIITGAGDLRASESSMPGAASTRPAVRQDIFNLDEGPVVLQYPAKMTAESFEDFEGWLNLQIKKIKRGIVQ